MSRPPFLSCVILFILSLNKSVISSVVCFVLDVVDDYLCHEG